VNDIEREFLNSMVYWWPRVVRLPVPKPTTVLITIEDIVDDVFVCTLSEGEDRNACKRAREKLDALSGLLDEYVRKYIGGYPVFLRSDYTSCKHYPEDVLGKPIYRIDSPDEFRPHITQLIVECHEFIPVRGVFGMPRPNAVAVREWIRVEKWTDKIPRFYGNLEVRVFVKGGAVERIYPYYHISGLKKYVLSKMSNVDYEEILREYRSRYVQTIIDGVDEITRLAETIARADGIREHDWSIDFVLAEVKGRKAWVFIDMALAEASWRPEEETDEDKLIMEAAKR